MGLPEIKIEFLSKATKVIGQGATGTLALILKDESATEVMEYKVSTSTDVPEILSDANKDYIEKALIGAPKLTKLIVTPNTALNYKEALKRLEGTQFNILAIPEIKDGETTEIANWIKAMRDNNFKKVIAVLPNESADSEGVINLVTKDIIVEGKTYTSAQYTSRVAGIIAGLPLTVAPTYQELKEVEDVERLDNYNEEIDAGKFVLVNDGEKVKIARGVTSLTTITEDKGEEWKKIKLVRIYDKVYSDIRQTIEDQYIGKVQNSYVNKLLLSSAINAYLEILETNNVLDSGKNRCEIDLVAQKTYLKSIGYTMSDGRSVDEMTEQEIKEANTRDQVFLKINIKALDAIEGISIKVFI